MNINLNQIIKKPQNLNNIKKDDGDKFIKLIELFYKNSSDIKINLLKELETEANIIRFEMEHKEIDEPIILSEELYKKIKIVFNSIEKKPLTYNEFINYYMCKLKHIIGKLEIIEKANIQINKIRRVRYKINEPLLFNYISNSLTTENKDNFDMNIINKFNILKPLFI